jgi:hypothetical protein
MQSFSLRMTLRTPPAKVDADGNFNLQHVHPSVYDVSVTKLPDSFYLKSVRLDNQEAIETGLELNGTGRHRLDLVVSGDAAQVVGIVIDSNEKPVGRATVLLVPAMRSAQRLYRSTNLGQDGRFSLRGIPPGRYRLYAWEEVEEGAWFDPDFMARYENDGESISLDSKDRKTVGLKLIPTPGGQPR